MPIDRPREAPDEPERPADGDISRKVDRPRPRDAPPPQVGRFDRHDRHEPDDAEPSPDVPAPPDAPRDTDGGRYGSTWARPNEDPQARYERARSDTAAGDALLDVAVRSPNA